MYIKTSLPERGEFVLGTIKKSEGHSVFFKLDEYDKLEGMLHSNEIDRKWKRKWKSKFKPGTKLVLKVIYINKQGQISLSQKQVGKSQNTRKLAQLKNEKTADGILTFFGKENKISQKQVYDLIGNKILKHHDLLYPVFFEVAKGNKKLIIDLEIKKDLANKLIKFIETRMTIPKKIIAVDLKIKSLASDGVEIIKKVIKVAEEIAKKHKIEFKIQYLGAPKYKLELIMDDYKIGEKAYSEIKDKMSKYLSKNHGSIKFSR